MREIHNIGAQTREWIISGVACPALSAYGIGACGISSARYGFEWVRHSPDFSVVLVCCGGSGEVFISGSWQHCKPGHAYVMPVQRLHAYRALKGKDWLVAWAVLRDGKAALFRLLNGSEPRLIACNPQPIHDVLRGLYREAASTRDPELARHWAALLDAHLARIVQPDRGDDRLWRVWERVDADPGFPWTNDMLARLAAMSPETLRRHCQQRLQRSPMEHVTFLRMTRAAALLSRSSDKIESVGRTVGYASLFAFSAAFKRFTGLPPSTYRKTHKL